jgi:hypothetical protein
MRDKEASLTRLRAVNQKLDDQLADLRSVVMLDQRAHNLGLAPALPMQVIRLPEPAVAAPEIKNSPRQLAVRQAEATQ